MLTAMRTLRVRRLLVAVGCALGVALASACGGGGGAASVPQQPTITTQSIANGTLSAGGAGGSLVKMQFSGAIAADETATVSTNVPAEVLALETGHVIGDGFTLTIGPQPVTALFDKCGGLSAGPSGELTQNAQFVLYDASLSPPSRVTTITLIGPHTVVICVSPPPPVPQALIAGHRYVAVFEV
jgi:hypothetical protein